jgi:flagellar biosynthesis/type III secretory pathway protein FliH
MRVSPHTCQKSHSVASEAIQDLPKSQRSPQRHKCAACAYERGLQTGYRQGLNEAKKVINQLINRGLLKPEDSFCPECGEVHIEGSHYCKAS